MSEENQQTVNTDEISQPVAGSVDQPQQQQSQQRQIQLQIDDSQATVGYASVTQVSRSAEEFTINFSRGIRPTGNANVARLKIDQSVIMSPFAAKRLAISLGKEVANYEKLYGTLELSEPKRRLGGEQQGGGNSGS